MSIEYVTRLSASADKFGFLLGDPWLFEVARDSVLLAQLREAVSQAKLASRDRAAFELGTIFVTRKHVDLRLLRTLDVVDSIASIHSDDPSIVMRARLTRAAVLGSLGEIELSRRSYESCMVESRVSEDHFAYALACKGFADASMFIGNYAETEEAYENALVTFRRYDYELLSAFVINNLGVLKKRACDYSGSYKLVAQARAIYARYGVEQELLNSSKNLGNICFRLGDWKASRRWLDDAAAIQERLTSATSNRGTDIAWSLATSVEHLMVVQRKFAEAERLLLEYDAHANEGPAHLVALVYEFLGELYYEVGDYPRSCIQLAKARELADRALPKGELKGEILRREAQVLLALCQLAHAKASAQSGIALSRRIGDRYEYAAALRVLGEVYVAQNDKPRAAACFRVAVHTLKSIHECYELMRTLYAQGRLLATNGKQDEAEIALLEARQLSKKLELEYYQALIAIAMADALGPQERFEEAQNWIAEATTLRDQLEGIDRERVEEALKRAAYNLQKLITCASVKSAETLKTICRVYEDARFPFEDMRADLAYQVAQSINAESLFVIGKSGAGYRVPITYNISTNESKETVRRLERVLNAKTLLNVNDEPQILKTLDGRTLLAVPCREDDSNPRARKSGDRFVACARFDGDVHPGPRQIELMCASAEALARIIEEEELRPARKPAAGGAQADEEAAEHGKPRHPRGSFKSILTIDSEMIKLIRTAERAAESVAPILLEGETGVGKELFARAIHEASRRKDGPFVAINAGGMSVHLLETELFGHVKGAFTDAGNDRTGLVDTARGGTLFFDEVGEMGEEMQVKLLRLMENGEYRRLGESSTRKADVRVISATNRDLKKDAERGLFRRDLYYRLSPLKLTIPPLRMRACDIQLMTRHFLRECAKMNGIADRYIEIDVKAMEALELYDWPGNVRELHNEILRVVSLIGRGDIVRFAMLSDSIKDFLKTKKRGDGLLDRSVEQYERRLILDALEKNDWNKLHTADAIGIPRTTLLAKLKRMNIASKAYPA